MYDDLNDYVKKGKQKGLSNSKIITNLKEAGWPTQKINEALKYNGITLTPVPIQKKKKGIPGWAIALIVIAVVPIIIFIAAVGISMFAYSGMLDFSNYNPERCDFGNQLFCTQDAIGTNEGIIFELKNALNTNILINEITFSPNSDCIPSNILVSIGSLESQYTEISKNELSQGDTILIKANCDLKSGDISENNVNIKYERTDSGTPYNVEGDLKLKIR